VPHLEFEYYKCYSRGRYGLTHLTHLTPFVKRPYFSGGTVACPASGTELESLLDRLTAATLRINRFDILSRYQDHNSSPSTRNMHSCQLLFVIDGNVHFYDLYEDRFYLTDSEKLGREWDRDAVYVIGLSDLLNISRYYGEFSLYLSLLDAGHVLGNAKNALTAADIPYVTYESPGAKGVLDRLGTPTDSLYASFMLELERPAGEMELRGTPRTGRIPTLKRFDELKPTIFVSPLLRKFRFASAKGRKQAEHRPPREALPIERLRSSAHTMIGNFNLSERFERFKAEEARRVLLDAVRQSSNPALRFCIAERHRLLMDDGSVKNGPIDFGRILHNDHEFFDLSTYSYVVVCFSEDRRIEDCGLLPVLLAAGELMQAACLYSAGQGYAFRPMKNHNDEYLKEVLELNDGWEINYIGVLCGSEVTPLRCVL